jgi:3-phosphoshikimate 1-carboxyvinyltransferase
MISISRNDRDITGEIRLPASKSISNRLLILQFLYGNSLKINNLSDSDDTLLLSSLLNVIRQHQLSGDTGLLRVDTRNAGSVMRFLIPLLSVTRGHYLMTGSERMKKRPVGPLVDAIRLAGAEIDYLENTGYPPFIIRGRPVTGSRIYLDASVSSQFVTALVLLAPTLEEGLTIELSGRPASWPFIKMTTALLSELGVQVIVQENSIRVFHKKDIKNAVFVECDWSSASFWYLMLSMTGRGELSFPGLRRSTLQGDQQVSELFLHLGVETKEEDACIRIVKRPVNDEVFRADFNDIPDLALPVIFACAVSGKPGIFKGLERLRIKESDRIEALKKGLRKAGLALQEEFPGTWRLSGHLIDPCILDMDDFGDHRVAMTFAGLATAGFTVNLEHPEVVSKSYPGFWNDMEAVGFNCNISC